jgi:hypothetical protein
MSKPNPPLRGAAYLFRMCSRQNECVSHLSREQMYHDVPESIMDTVNPEGKTMDTYWTPLYKQPCSNHVQTLSIERQVEQMLLTSNHVHTKPQYHEPSLVMSNDRSQGELVQATQSSWQVCAMTLR